MPSSDGGLGEALVGEKLMVNTRQVQVSKLLGEGGFSYVYLVKELSDTSNGGEGQSQRSGSVTGASSRGGSLGIGGGRRASNTDQTPKLEMVLKVTSILSRQQRDIAEKEAKLLERLSHPSIIKMYDTCYRTVTQTSRRGKSSDDKKDRPQHLILMEFCEGGHALEVCTRMSANGERFDLSTLIIAFGQICNAVSYLHAQRPPIVHRDLKPANFLVKNGAYKLCDFGSAVFGHVDLKTQKARVEAEEVIEKTTTQMFRAPEMVDLYMAKKLTQATDVWALGACLYSLAFLQNCFEEGSNLAILSRKFKIPDDNPYGDGLVELIDRMLTVDSKERADMTEVILCLSAVYSGRPLPPRKDKSSSKTKEKEKETDKKKKEKKDKEKTKEKVEDPEKESVGSGQSGEKGAGKKAGTFRTDTQGVYQQDLALNPDALAKKEAKKLAPNSAAARRRAANADRDLTFESMHSSFEEPSKADPNLAFSTTENPFASFDVKNENSGESNNEKDIFASFDDSAAGASKDDDVRDAFSNDQEWAAGTENGGTYNDFATFAPGEDAKMTRGNADEEKGGDNGAEDGDDNNKEENEGKREKDKSKPKPRRKSKSGSGSSRGQRTSVASDEKSDRSDKGRRVRRTRSGEKDKDDSSSHRRHSGRAKSGDKKLSDLQAAANSKDKDEDAKHSKSKSRRPAKDGDPKSSRKGKSESGGHRHKDKDGHHKEGHSKSRTPTVDEV